MAIALSQDDYWSFFYESEVTVPQADSFDIVRICSGGMGKGFVREIDLPSSDGVCVQSHGEHVTFSISNYA